MSIRQGFKIQILFISILVGFALVFTGCSGGGGGTNTPTASSAPPVTSPAPSPAPPSAPAGDTTAPAVSSVSPGNNAAAVAVNSTITATFSEGIDAATITTATFTLDNGATGAVSYSGTTATFTPSASLLYLTTYTATITIGVKDTAGNPMAANFTWSFTTKGAPGSLDTTFNTTGIVTTDIGGNTDIATAATIQSDGKIVAAGYSSNGANNDFALTRYNTDGSLDTTFGTGGKVTTGFGGGNELFYAVAIQPDGNIVAAGTGNCAFMVGRYNTNGTLDTTFGIVGVVGVGIGGSFCANAYAVAIQSDGKIIAVGRSHDGADDDFALVRHNTNGSLDTTFNTTGIVTTDIGGNTDIATAATIQSDGKIVLAGYSNNGTDDDFALVRYNPDGSLDATFDTDGIVTTDIGGSMDRAEAVAIQPDGKIVVTGFSSDDFALVRYNADGSLDTTFDTDGIITTDIEAGVNDYSNAVSIQLDGKIVAAGSSSGDFALVRYNIDGSLDTTFDTDGIVTTAIGASWDIAYSIAIQSDGNIVAAGYSNNGTDDDFALARYWQ